MGSVMGEERHLDNCGSSLLMSPIKYKRRKVSVVRDFPFGCSPNATSLCKQTKEKEVQGVDGLNVDDILKDKDGDICEAARKGVLELKDPSGCLNGGELRASSLATCGKVEYKNVELKKFSVEKANTFEEIQIIGDIHILTDDHNSSNDLTNVRLEFPTTFKDSGVVDPKELADAANNSMGEGGTSVEQRLLPHYPIPSNLVRKEHKYPLPRRVSAVLDFPFVEMNTQAPMLGQPSEFKRRETNFEHNNDEQHMQDIEQSGYGGKDESDIGSLPDRLQNNVIILKDENKKKKSVGVSSNIEEGIIVQGLMCEASCPWRQVKEPAKLSMSPVSAKESKGMKYGYGEQDEQKRSLTKRKDNAEKSKMIVPCLMEAGEVSRPLPLGDNEDSSENEEPNDFPSHPSSVAGSSSERGARSNVRETLKLYQTLVRMLLQEQEIKPKENGKARNRVDISAANKLKEKGKYINSEKVIGAVPGVEIGDFFTYRAELAIIGIHGPWQSGIDTVKQGKDSIAVSVVASGGYDNDVDSSDVLIYTGQGGNPMGADKQPEDQKLGRGNLALKNCIDAKNPVRVTRGFKEAKPADNVDGKPKMTTTYTYDGLYTVERYWQDLGHLGNLVYKFELRRIPGQRQLAWKEVKRSKKCRVREGCCVDDISKGKDKPPICAINTIDDDKPPPFTYITSMIYPDWCRPLPLAGCDCKDGCSDSHHCACAVKNGGEIPYNLSGAIILAKPLVYECGSSCNCPPSCPNRVSQHGIKLPLEIFKTETRGWGVRCLSSISSGSFICEYIGELLDDKQAEQRVGSDEYLFDIGQNYNDTTLSDGLSALMPNMPSIAIDVVENVGFTIDALRYGNIGRFINHSCSPNLYAQNVLYDHGDKRIPHIMLFAAENIPPLEELTYHYNYTIDQVFDSKGKIKKKYCYCGSAECTGRMY